MIWSNYFKVEQMLLNENSCMLARYCIWHKEGCMLWSTGDWPRGGESVTVDRWQDEFPSVSDDRASTSYIVSPLLLPRLLGASSAYSVATRLQTGQPRIRGLMPGRGEKFFSHPPKVHIGAGADPHLVPGLRMGEFIPPLPQSQLNFYLKIYVIYVIWQSKHNLLLYKIYV